MYTVSILYWGSDRDLAVCNLTSRTAFVVEWSADLLSLGGRREKLIVSWGTGAWLVLGWSPQGEQQFQFNCHRWHLDRCNCFHFDLYIVTRQQRSPSTALTFFGIKSITMPSSEVDRDAVRLRLFMTALLLLSSLNGGDDDPDDQDALLLPGLEPYFHCRTACVWREGVERKV